MFKTLKIESTNYISSFAIPDVCIFFWRKKD